MRESKNKARENNPTRRAPGLHRSGCVQLKIKPLRQLRTPTRRPEQSVGARLRGFPGSSCQWPGLGLVARQATAETGPFELGDGRVRVACCSMGQ